MSRPRVIPILLMNKGGLYKTRQFQRPSYVGDPINTMRLFNDKEVDEIALLDIGATREGRGPDFDTIADIVSESFMPLAYGGGVRSINDARKLFDVGVEKVILGTAALKQPELIGLIAEVAGSQAVVVSIDVKKTFLSGQRVFVQNGKKSTRMDPVTYAQRAVRAGAGELLLTSIDREGMMAGYDLELTRKVSGAVGIPVIAHGGARNLTDLKAGIQEGQASAVAAGSMFVYQGPHRAVLINYPPARQIDTL